MVVADQPLTLWDPGELFRHLALWAGAPAGAVAIVVGVLGVYSWAKAWLGFGQSVVHVAKGVPGTIGVVEGKFRGWMPAQQRAMVRLLLFSVFAVAFSYMLAEIIYVVVQMIELDPSEAFSVSSVRTMAVEVTPWPSPVVLTVVLESAGIGLLGVASIVELRGLHKLVTFLGGVARVVAWAGAVMLGLMTLGGLASPLPIFRSAEGSSGAVPLSFAVTTGVATLLCIGLALSLPRVRDATDTVFG